MEEPALGQEVPAQMKKGFEILLDELANAHEREVRDLKKQLRDARATGTLDPAAHGCDGQATLGDAPNSKTASFNPEIEAVDGDVPFTCNMDIRDDADHGEDGDRKVKALPSAITGLPKHIICEDLALVKGWKKSILHNHKGRHHIGYHAKCGFLYRMITSTTFESVSSVFIMVNCVYLGVNINWQATNPQAANDPVVFAMLNYIFTVLFTVELTLRVLGHGPEFFFAQDWSWNWFDFIVVSGDLIDMLVGLVFGADAGNGFTIIRVLRVLRVTRALRVIRLFSFFREFRMMVLSILSSAGALGWSMVLFILNMYLFSAYFVQTVAVYRSNVGVNQYTEDLDRFFGTMVRSVYTLFLAVSGGISWVEIADPLFEIHWFNCIVFVFYVFFTVFALTNIITGIFVETAIQGAQNDRDEVMQQHMSQRDSQLNQLRELFVDADQDASGSLTLHEFEQHLKASSVRVHLQTIGLQIDEARGLFKLLDLDHSGVITIEEFIFGCMRFKGQARSIDLATLMYENKRMYQQMKVFFKYCEHMFSHAVFPFESGHRSGRRQDWSEDDIDI